MCLTDVRVSTNRKKMETAKTRELTNFHYISLTDVGRRRQNNEDSAGYFDTPNGHVFVVCDGCGGMPCGERASQGVANSMKFFFNNFYYKDPVDAIKDAIKYAHNFLISEGEKDWNCAGMATTVVLVLIRYNKVYYGHVGDSRIYFASGRELRQITRDDSYVQHLVDRGEITPEQAETHPRKNELMQVMGQENEMPEPHVCKEPILPSNGDMLLLCTDGLFNMVESQYMKAVLMQHGYIEDKGAQLIKAALDNGGLDNVTLQIIKFFNVETTAESTGQTPVMMHDDDKTMPRGRTSLTIAILAIILLVLGVLLYLRGNRRHEPFPQDSATMQELMVKYDLDTLGNADSVIQAFGIPPNKVIYTNDNGHRLMCVPVKAIITTRYYDNLNTLQLLYNTPKERIARVNNLGDSEIKPAQQLIIPL